MDFKNMLQKNVGNMKSKLPSIPNIPKMPKIKSRKIFNLNRSKENVSNDNDNFTSSHLSIGPPLTSSQLQLPVPSSTIINRSPSRISTISSLVEGNEQIDYNISDRNHQRHIHFDDPNNDPQKSQLRFTERLTKQYKELSEFKFSHIFGKKTIVRKTEIHVDMYKQSVEEQNNELKAERRISKDYDIEFRTIPATSRNIADEPQTPLTNFQSLQRIPSTSFGFQQTQLRSPSNIRSTNEIKNISPDTPPPLSKRKIFNPQYDEAAEEARKEEKSIWKIKKFKKKSSIKNNNDDASGSGSSDIQKNYTKSKSLNNIFKKLSSFDETTNDDSTKSPRKSSMWKLTRPIRVKVSTENIPNESNSTQDSEFMKQFNKIVGKSSKIKNLIAKETSSTNENIPQQQTESHDPNKTKTMEEIESFGYGRKNLKFINMWKVRRRREIRRSEPFPLNRGESQDEDSQDDTTKSSGMWQLRRATRVKSVFNEGDPIDDSKKPQLAEITKSLMTLFKRNQISNEPNSANVEKHEQKKRKSFWKKDKTVGPTENNEYNETCMESNSPITYPQHDNPGQNRKSKIRQAIGQELDDTDWKNISPNQKYLRNENVAVNEESVVDVYRENQTSNVQTKSIALQHKPIQNYTSNVVTSNDLKNNLHSMDSFESCSEYSDHDSMEAIQGLNKNLSVSRQNILSTAYASDSDDDDVITTSGFMHNQPTSMQCAEIEPTIIIVSKPVPSILQYESVIQQQRIYPPQLALNESCTTTQNSAPSTYSQHLKLPAPVVLPTPPLPKRQFSPPIVYQPDIIVSRPHNSLPTSRSPSPPLPPTSLPPELSPPPKSPPIIPAPKSPTAISPTKSPLGISPPKSPPAVPTSPRPQISIISKLSPVLQQTDLNIENKSQSNHSRKPSMDSTNSEPLTADNFRNHNVIEMKKIEDTLVEQCNSFNISNLKEGDSLKKWKSTDIFNGNDQIFDDFDDELKNEPIIIYEPIITTSGAISKPEHKMPLSHGKSNSDLSQPSGVPVSLEKHKIIKPLVKQGSLRRQFSEEKDAEDLNKKRNVNKMISRFDPERFSSRRSIKYEPIQINSTTTEKKDSENKFISNEVSIVVSHHSPTNLNLNRSSSLDVEIDNNDLESRAGSTTEDDSDNTDSGDLYIVRPPTVLERKQPSDSNDNKVQKTAENSVKLASERKVAPLPPSAIQSTTAVATNKLSNQNEDNRIRVDQKQTNDNKPVIKDPTKIQSVEDSNGNKQNLNIKKNISQIKQQSEDNFYSLDYTERDETVQGYPLDGMSLVKEEYSIDL